MPVQRKLVVGVASLSILVAALLAWHSCGTRGASPSNSTSGGARSASLPGKRNKDATATGPASLAGRVTRASDGAGIAGAVVSIAPAEIMAMIVKNDAPTMVAIADANGVWKAPRVRPGAYVVAAAATGYLPTARAKLTVAAGEARTGVDLVLAAGGTVVRGTVTDIGGGPIAEARVTANPDRIPDLFGHADLVALTGADGRYELTLPDGAFELHATHDDYRGDEESVEVAGAPLTVDFKLVPGAVIRGQVIARDTNKPVPGALVNAGNGNAIADDAGNFTLRSLAAGSLEIKAIGRGYASATPTQVAVGIGEQIDGVRVLVERAYSIAGRVVRKGKQEGLAGVTLGAFSIARKTFGLALEPSGDDGSFEIVGLRPAGYMLFAVGEGSVPDLGKNVEVVDKDVTGVIVELDAGVTLVGRVEPPVASVQIAVEPTGSIGFANMFEAVKAALVRGETDARGQFALHNVPAGSFVLKASATDGRSGSTPALVGAVDVDGIVVKLEPRGSVSGRVVDTSGKPAGGIAVEANRTDDHESGKISFSRRRNDTTTAPDGTFKLVGLDTGKYRVEAIADRDDRFARTTKKDSKSHVELDIAAGAPKTGVTLTIEARDGIIRGVVLGPDRKPTGDAWVTAHHTREHTDSGDDDAPRRRWGGSAPVLTNAEGQFTIGKLERGTYDLVVQGPRGATHAEKPGVKTGDSTTIQLLSLGTLAGKVTAAGAPVAKYDIECKSDNGTREQHVEAKDGAYQLDHMTPGAYRCEVDSDVGTVTAKLDIGASPMQRDFALTRWASLTGTVVSALDRKPVAGVLVFAGTDYSERRFMTAIAGTAPKTDANGRFIVEHVGVGKGKAVVMPNEGFQPLGTRDYTVAEGQRVDIGTIEIVPPRTGDAGTFGLSTSVDSGNLVVASVKEGGPAATAGVQVGDRITAINGRDVAQLTPALAALLIASGNVGVGQQVMLSLQRASTPIQVALVSVKW